MVRKKYLFDKPVWCFVFGLFLVITIVLSYKVYQSEKIYRMSEVLDGSTVKFIGGKTVKLLGVDIKNDGYSASMSISYLNAILENRNVWIEPDKSTGNDGENIVRMWVGCESNPKFLASELVGDKGNPIGCKKGVLVNEQIVKMGWTKMSSDNGL